MHIGFDISQTGADKAGCGYFAHAMIEAMLELAPEHRYSLFPSFGDFYFDARMPLRSPYQGKDVRSGPRHFSLEAARTFWNSDDLQSALDRPDVVHANNFWCPLQLTTSRLIYTLYDLGFAENPSWTTESNRVGCFEGVFRSAMVADWVAAISESSRSHYLRSFPHFPEDRIRVIHPCSRFTDSTAVGHRPKSLDSLTPGTFWLTVGTIEPRKNQRRLVEAYARYLKLGGVPMPLVLAGGKGWLMDDFERYIDDWKLQGRAIMIGYVTDDELIWLYRNCYANLYPSLFEGFGLPVLEGMQFGAPTVASDSTSIPEVTGDAAILISPKDVDGWTQSMLRLASDTEQRNRLGTLACARAAQFARKRSAAAILELYQEAMALPKRHSQQAIALQY